MNNITLRPAIASDRSMIWKLVVQNNLNVWDLRWKNFLVAVDNEDRFVGCGQVKRHGNTEELASLVVIEEWQGHGVSKILMDALMERAGRPLWLMCESSLISYYRKFGFEETTEVADLPPYFRTLFWATRLPSGAMFLIRGTYVAFMAIQQPCSTT